MKKNTPDFSVILPAAGKGTRLGSKQPKAFYPIRNKPMLLHSASPFLSRNPLVELIIVHPPGKMDQLKQPPFEKLTQNENVQLTPGGSSRLESVKNGFRARTQESELILIHDAARPLVSADIIHRVIDGVAKHGAAIAALSISDTVKRVRDEHIEETVDRTNLYRAQTPQGFRTEWFEDALNKCSEKQAQEMTDDASIVSAAGYPVHLVKGDQTNIKITYPGDVEMAEALIEEI